MQLYNRPPMPLRTPDTLPVLLSLTVGGGGYVAALARWGSVELALTGGGIATVLAALWFGTWHYHVAMEQEQTERLAVEYEHDKAVLEPPPAYDVIQTPQGVYNRATNTLTITNTGRKPRKRNPFRGHRLEMVTRAAVMEDPTGNHIRYYDVGELFWRWAKYGGADATSTAEREWTPKSAGKAFEPDEYLALRKWLFGQGLAWWKNEDYHKAGWELRNRARAIMRSIRDLPTAPTHVLVPYSVDDNAVG